MTKKSMHLFVLVVLGAVCSLPVFGNTITVTTTADNGPGSLRAAIALASTETGDTINFSLTYPATITLTSGDLPISNNLTISGPGANNLAISGNNLVQVLQINAGATVIMSGLTIESSAGAGISNYGTLTLSNCTISGNLNDGGIQNWPGGTLTLNSSTVSGNSVPDATAHGGGILNLGTLTLNNSTVSGNSAPAGHGGGISNNGGTLTLNNSTVSGNSVFGNGGGIENFGPLTLNNTTISDNFARLAGGGMILEGGLTGETATVNNSTVSGNSAIYFGGGIYNSSTLNTISTLTVSNSTLSDNSVTAGDGGGIYNDGTLMVSNSTLSGNTAQAGVSTASGIANHGTLTVSNSTLSGNFGGIDGGNLSNFRTLTLKATILANSAIKANCSYGTYSDGGYNLSDDTTCSSFLTSTTDQNNVPAGLDPNGLQNNGGRTQTIALLSTSPAVDAIPSASCTDVNGNPVTTDQRGVARPQGSGCDIGAFELATAGSTPPGNNVNVQPVDSTTGTSPITLTFSNVTQGGTTTLTTSGTGAPPPNAFKLGNPPVYYELNTTAVFSGTVTICVNYSNIKFGNSSRIRLFHYQGAWADVTTSVNSANTTICGTVSSFSQFAIFELLAYTAIIQPPIRADGSSVFNANRGAVPVKFTLALNGTPTCQLPPATISLTATASTTAGGINEGTFSLPSDNGSDFRIDTINCQYVYNLHTGSLGPGTYGIQILISDVAVGTATFGLR